MKKIVIKLYFFTFLCYTVFMKEAKFFIDAPEIVKFFVVREEKELVIQSVGYNNFHFVKPQLFLRSQEQFTLHFVLSGSGTLNVGGVKRHISRHQVFALDNRCEFCYYPDKETPWEYVWFDFTGARSEEYLREAGFSQSNPVLDCAEPQRLTAAFKKIFTDAEKQNAVSYFDVASAFFATLSTVSSRDEKTIFFYHDDYIEEIKRFIMLKYLYEDFNVEYLSRSMHISHSHLCRIFKKSEGVSVIEYVNALRMKRAEELLEKTDLTAREIAYMSGFKEYEYFLKCFKKSHGVTTSAFRSRKQSFSKSNV